jgi:hypothetical protein
VRPGLPPLLRWTPVRGARYYNLQLWRRGTQILSVWPARPRYQLKRRWRYGGRSWRLEPGRYRWFVWPGFGPRSKADYGRRIGPGRFRVARPWRHACARAPRRAWRIAVFERKRRTGETPGGPAMWPTFVSIKGGSYARFRRALGSGNLTLVRAAAAELPSVNLEDALRICVLLRNAAPSRYERAVMRWLGRLYLERPRLTLEELRRALAACERLPQDPDQAVIELRPILSHWLAGWSVVATDHPKLWTCRFRLEDRRRQILEGVSVEQRLVELPTVKVVHLGQRRVADDLPDAAA